MSKQNIDERRQNLNLVGATVNAPGAELANSSHSHECLVDPHLQAPNQTGAAGNGKIYGTSATLGFSDLVPVHRALNCDDDRVDVLGKKITISVQRGKKTVTKVEGIPAQFSLAKLLKKLRAKDMLSCGGHVAKDKESGSELLVLQGSFSAEVAAFLTREGLADAECILRRG